MDPLSLVAGVIAVTEASLATVKVLRKFKNARSETKEVLEEVENLHHGFKQAEEVLSRPEVFATLSVEAKEALSIVALNAKRELAKIQLVIPGDDGLKDGSEDGLKIRRTTWLLHGSAIKKSCERLRELQANLAFINGGITIAGNSNTHLHLKRLEAGPLAEIRDWQIKNDNLLGGIVQQQHQLIESLQPFLNPGAGYLQTAVVSSIQPLALASTSNNLVLPSYSSSSSLSSAFTSQNMQLDITRFAELSSVDGCSVSCSCICHRPSKMASPEYLTALIGHFHLRYTGANSSGVHCSETRCKKRSFYTAKMAYRAPDWLASRIFSMSLSSRNGLHIVIRAPRIVSDDAPILRAAAARDLVALQSLIGGGLASPADVGDSYGLTALHIAFVNKDMQMCRFLLQNGADAYNETTLRRSVIDIVRDEIINGKVTHSQNSELDAIFEELDDYESFQLSSLHKSLLGMSRITLEMQLSASTVFIDTPDSFGRTTLSAAAWRGDAASVAALLAYGASPNICTPTEISPLHRAIEGHSFECVRLLVNAGADVNHHNKRGRLPLHYSCRIRDGGQMCELLLQSGADVDALDHGGSSAVHEAVVHGNLPQLRLLVEHGAGMNCLTADGEFPLKLAVGRNDVEMASELLDAKADPRLGQGSLLCTAAQCASAEMLEFLASNVTGLDMNIVDVAGKTPLQLFEARQDEPTKEMRRNFLRLGERDEMDGSVMCDQWFDALTNLDSVTVG